MKKLLLPILLFMMFVPFVVKAESKYLYDVLKDEAENGGLAREYTGEHHDSFIKEPSKKIYHWYANNDNEGNQILEKNNVIFANHCWKIIRTTDTGGVKLIYNGEVDNNKCLDTRTTHTGIRSTQNITITDSYYYGTNYIYNKDNNQYTLSGSINKYNNNESNKEKVLYKYTCLKTSSDESCPSLYYINSFVSDDTASAFLIQPNSVYSNYGILGNSKYNSPADGGYMYNKQYESISLDFSDSITLSTSFSYSDGKYTLGSNRITTKLKSSNDYNTLSQYHYSCSGTNTECEKIMFIYYIYNKSILYIELEGGESINDAMKNMVSDSNLNKYDSIMKIAVDSFFQNYLIDYKNYIEETIFCNNRSVKKYGGFSQSGNLNGGTNENRITFGDFGLTYTSTNVSLSCNKDTDKFSIMNDQAHLKYSIGLQTAPEVVLTKNKAANKSGLVYYLMTPSMYLGNGVSVFAVYTDGSLYTLPPANQYGIKPSISLAFNLKYINGDGSTNSPYVIDTNSRYQIYVEKTNEIEDAQFNLNNLTNIEFGKEVIFKLTPKTGYQIDTMKIIDMDGNDLDFSIIDDSNEYTFNMPSSDVRIVPTYEKVKSSVNLEIVNETEDFTISIDDMSQVEFDEEVTFKVTPIKGYKVKDIKIVDIDGNEIEYNTTDNMNYSFAMPASDVTIKPSYERVASSIEIEDNEHTKEFIIEVNDSKAVVYEDKVKFTIIPEEGYEVENIEIKDKEENKIEYRKTDKEYEYEFTMPASDVVIIPTYRKIESINVADTLKNPNTGTGISIIIIFMLIISSITYIIFKRKKKYIMK